MLVLFIITWLKAKAFSKFFLFEISDLTFIISAITFFILPIALSQSELLSVFFDDIVDFSKDLSLVR